MLGLKYDSHNKYIAHYYKDIAEKQEKMQLLLIFVKIFLEV